MPQVEPERRLRHQSRDEKRLVLVVHGVGDDAPGAAVGQFARALALATERRRTPTEEVLWLPEGSGRQVNDFPCHVQRLRDAVSETVMAEVYWADLSRLRPGIFHTGLGLFRLIFGLHRIVARYAPDPVRPPGPAIDRAAQALQKLSQVSAYLLRGPVAAATVTFVAGWAFGFGLLSMGGDALGEDHSTRVVPILIAVSFSTLLAGCFVVFRTPPGRLYRPLFLWLGLIGLAILPASWLAGLIPPTHADALGTLWLAGLMVVLGSQSLAGWLILIATLAWLVARVRAQTVDRPGLDLAQAVNFLTLGLWLIVLFYLLTIARERLQPLPLPKGIIQETTERLLNSAELWFVLLVIVALIGLAILIATWLRLRLWAKANQTVSYAGRSPTPRLLVGKGIVGFLTWTPILLFTVLVAPLIVARLPSAWTAGLPGLATKPAETLVGFVSAASRIVIPVAVLTAGWAGWALRFSKHLRIPLDLGLDIVRHFELQPSEDGDGLDFVPRKKIRKRFQTALKTLVEREQPSRVTIVAHSQGTIVAIEALAEDSAADILRPLEQCDLVTMGSPFSHMYQHYFPSEYPALSQEKWAGLRQRVGRWCNVFRIDDYVGTDIEPDGDRPENCPVDPGGHTGYWRDRRVLESLHDRQLV